METALFCINFDRGTPDTKEEAARLVHAGEGRNKWFDKSFTSVIFDNGRGGLNAEHTPVDVTCLRAESIQLSPRPHLHSSSCISARCPRYARAAGDDLGVSHDQLHRPDSGGRHQGAGAGAPWLTLLTIPQRAVAPSQNSAATSSPLGTFPDQVLAPQATKNVGLPPCTLLKWKLATPTKQAIERASVRSM